MKPLVWLALLVSAPVFFTGGLSLQSTGLLPSTTVAYSRIQPAGISSAPAGFAFIGLHQDSILVSETAIPVSTPVLSGRIYAEINAPINTAIALANPNDQPATISFFFTDANGDFGQGTITIPANNQTAKFLSEPPFKGPPSLKGAFTFRSSLPIAAAAFRTRINERSEFLFTTLPVADLSLPSSNSALIFSHFARNAGWATQIVLVNTTDAPMAGSILFGVTPGVSDGFVMDPAPYFIPPRSSTTLGLPSLGPELETGSVRVVPGNSPAPSGFELFSFFNGQVTVTEAGIPASSLGTSFRTYVEATASTQTAIAMVNNANSASAVTFEISDLTGASTGLIGTASIQANSQTALFVNQIQGLATLPMPFQGVLRISASSPISLTALRIRYNERGELLLTGTPPLSAGGAPQTSAVFFPQIVDSGGWTTQFILFGADSGFSSGTLQLFSQSGGPSNITLQ